MSKNKADTYLKETIKEILEDGQWDKNPRTRWSDGIPAHSKFITQKVFQYDIAKGEFPITTLRTTALRGSFFDIEAIYIKQTNILEEMHPSIHSWWKDFIVDSRDLTVIEALKNEYKIQYGKEMPIYRSENIGATYGATVRRYNLMNRLLKGLEENPFGRRHIIDMWQEQQMIDDPKALVPCAYSTLWSVREVNIADAYNKIMDKVEEFICTPLLRDEREIPIRYIDLTLMQRSQDFVMTASINPVQYVMLGMIVCNHLTFKTGIEHKVGKFLHIVQNCHIYDRHLYAAEEILEREETELQPKIKLKCNPKDFYSHTFEDFEFEDLEGIKPLSFKLEIAI